MADYSDLIASAATANGVDPALLTKLVGTESSFNPNAVNSSSGAVGLGQLMPGTAAGLGVTDPKDPTQNINGAAQYLRQGLDKYGGDTTKALMYYYGGPNEANWGPLTRAYPAKVLGTSAGVGLPANATSALSAAGLFSLTGPILAVPQLTHPAVSGPAAPTAPAPAPAPVSAGIGSPLLALGLAPKIKYTPIDYDPFAVEKNEVQGPVGAGGSSGSGSGFALIPSVKGHLAPTAPIVEPSNAVGGSNALMNFLASRVRLDPVDHDPFQPSQE